MLWPRCSDIVAGKNYVMLEVLPRGIGTPGSLRGGQSQCINCVMYVVLLDNYPTHTNPDSRSERIRWVCCNSIQFFVLIDRQFLTAEDKASICFEKFMFLLLTRQTPLSRVRDLRLE